VRSLAREELVDTLWSHSKKLALTFRCAVIWVWMVPGIWPVNKWDMHHNFHICHKKWSIIVPVQTSMSHCVRVVKSRKCILCSIINSTRHLFQIFTKENVGGWRCQQNSWLTVSGSIGKKGAGSLFAARNVIGWLSARDYHVCSGRWENNIVSGDDGDLRVLDQSINQSINQLIFIVA